MEARASLSCMESDLALVHLVMVADFPNESLDIQAVTERSMSEFFIGRSAASEATHVVFTKHVFGSRMLEHIL